MPDWKAPLAFEDATGQHPAKFDFDPDTKTTSYVRCRVYGQKFASPFNPNTWFTGIKVDEKTGASLTSAWPGKIVNVPEDLTAGLDLDSGQPKRYTLAEAAAILGAGAPGGQADQIVRIHLTAEYPGGRKEVLGSVDA